MSPDGRWVATGCADRRTRVLDATTGTEVFGTDADGKVFDVAFGPRGTLLATAGEDGGVVVVETATMAVRARFRNFGCSLVAFNHEETLLATAWDDNTVSVLDITASGTPPELLRLNQPGPVTTLAFDPVGPALGIATGTPTVRLVDRAAVTRSCGSPIRNPCGTSRSAPTERPSRQRATASCAWCPQ